jgi:diadenosine tetraphosphate (Ap4A) HIT family hydrolase
MTIPERLNELELGHNPLAIARMPSGYAVMADVQYLEGYSILLAYPAVASLNDLKAERRIQFLNDMGRLGDAIQAATGATRINYGIYGNVDPYLHVHVWPRYDHEDHDLRGRPPFTFPEEFRNNPERVYSELRHGGLKRSIADHLGPEHPGFPKAVAKV